MAVVNQLVDRRQALRVLAVLLSGALAGLASEPSDARRRHRNHGKGGNPRKRLRKQCHQQCNAVHQDCLHLYCDILGYPDDICHPQCAIAKQSCRQGCA